jgi:hypothetical protein
MYIRFRHHLVMAFTCLRARRVLPLFGYSLMAFASSPFDMVREMFTYVRKIQQNR